eukprot:TRINITY_DN112477_c0_g1_i1.p1 TRINITY_DN112477_c0_g1~~TRINITY_DN112477_c0_g1_i1.p1  ORF type:complete len:245 (-),score=29.76 TRINITY_DN112477_c0_g1_i1:79-813(-)
MAQLCRGRITSFVVQSSWDEEEDQELLDFVNKSGLPVTIMDEDDIVQLKPNASQMIFADTSLIQKMIGSTAVVDTYPDCFDALYCRRIEKKSDITQEHLPFFVKPAGRHKAFEARVVRTAEDLETVKILADGEEVYVGDAVQFVCEYRLFLGTSKIWGVQEYSDFVIGEEDLRSTPIPDDVVASVAKANQLGNVVVDVGLTTTGKWCVVEANPPFALSSYGLDISVYVEYCCQAWVELLDQLKQ